MKCAISGDCLLQFYGASHPLLIECDASKKGVGCVLLQPVDKSITDYDISYFSDKEIEEFLQHLKLLLIQANPFQMQRLNMPT